MLRAFTLLRAIALLKRIATAAERIAVAQEKLASAVPVRGRAKMAEVFTPSVEERDAAWEARNGTQEEDL